jgi:hypothetical protein
LDLSVTTLLINKFGLYIELWSGWTSTPRAEAARRLDPEELMGLETVGFFWEVCAAPIGRATSSSSHDLAHFGEGTC